jgi:hypothetical protein
MTERASPDQLEPPLISLAQFADHQEVGTPRHVTLLRAKACLGPVTYRPFIYARMPGQDPVTGRQAGLGG